MAENESTDAARPVNLLCHGGVQWLTSKQLIGMLHISTKTLQQWREHGLKPRNPPRCDTYFWRSDEVAEFLDRYHLEE